MGILGQHTILLSQFQHMLQMHTQLRQKCKRSATEEHFRFHLHTSCQCTHHLHGHSSEHRRCYVVLAHSSGQKILYVCLRKNSASRRDRVNGVRQRSQLVKFCRLNTQQRCCLVDKRPRSSRAVSIHPHVWHSPLFEEYHLRIFSSHVYKRMYIRILLAYHFRSCNHLLLEINIHPFGITHPYAAGHHHLQRMLTKLLSHATKYL